MRQRSHRTNSWLRAPWLRISSILLIATLCLANTARSCDIGGVSLDGQFNTPSCVRLTHWDLKKVANQSGTCDGYESCDFSRLCDGFGSWSPWGFCNYSGLFNSTGSCGTTGSSTPSVSCNSIKTAFAFDITVTEGCTDNIIRGSGKLFLSNVSNTTYYLTGVGLNLEKKQSLCGYYYGFGGTSWSVLGTAVQNVSGTGTCLPGGLKASEGCSLVLQIAPGAKVAIPHTDLSHPPVPIAFTYEFKIDGLNSYCSTYWTDPGRFELIATYAAGDNTVRAVQDCTEFPAILCSNWVNKSVKLNDEGARLDATDPGCVNTECLSLTSEKIVNQIITACGAGTVHRYTVKGTADCTPQTASQLKDYLAGLGTVGLDTESPAPLTYCAINLSNAGALTGTHAGWCASGPLDEIYNATPYGADLYSSCDPDAIVMLNGLRSAYNVAHPDVVYPLLPVGNMDLANWVINQHYVGKYSGYGTYTINDVQEALWCLILSREPNQADVDPPLSDRAIVRVRMIIAAAKLHHGFTPGPCQEVLVLVHAVNGPYYTGGEQLVMFPIPVCNCRATIINQATLTANDPCQTAGATLATAEAKLGISCDNGKQPELDPGDYVTYTETNWDCIGKDSCNPLNRALTNYFDTLFPNNDYYYGFLLGDPNGRGTDDGLWAIEFDSAAAVFGFLPQNGENKVLLDDILDPPNTPSLTGDIGGQLAAAKLNLAFDAVGLTGKQYPDGSLGTLYFADNQVVAALRGLTVNQVVALADLAISGSPTSVSLDDLNTALKLFNANFKEGVTDRGHLAFPVQ